MSFRNLIIEGDEVAVNQTLEVDPSLALELQKSQNYLAIHDAASHGRNEIIKTLFVMNPSQLDAKTEDDYTPLQLAAENGHASTVALLVRLGSKSIDAAIGDGWSGRTAMHLAAMQGHSNVIEVLAQLGSTKLDALADGGETPFFDAVEEGHVETALTLFRLGSQAVDMADNEGRTPLHIAAMNCDAKMVDALLNVMKSKATRTLTKSGETPVIRAAYSLMNMDPTETVKLLWKADSGAFQIEDRHSDFPQAPFHLAVYSRSIETVKFLLGKGEFPVDAQDKNGHTAMTIAANRNDIEMMTLLLQFGSQAIDTPSVCFERKSWNEGALITPIWQAFLADRTRGASFLLALGADHTLCNIPEEFREEFDKEVVEKLTEDKRANYRYPVYFGESLVSRLLREDRRLTQQRTLKVNKH